MDGTMYEACTMQMCHGFGQRLEPRAHFRYFKMPPRPSLAALKKRLTVAVLASHIGIGFFGDERKCAQDTTMIHGGDLGDPWTQLSQIGPSWNLAQINAGTAGAIQSTPGGAERVFTHVPLELTRTSRCR